MKRFTKFLLWISVLYVAIMLSIQNSYSVPTGFVFPSGSQFRIMNSDGTSSPYFYSGTNNYYLMYKPMTMVNDVLNDMLNLNQRVVRMWFFMDGTTTHDGYVLQSAAGVYNAAGMAHIDEVMAACSQRGLKVVPVFVNYWSDFGGMPQYAAWAGSSADQFFSNATCKQLFKNYVANWLNRTNTITGIQYKNDPTVMAWQLTNEARCTASTMSDYVSWVNEMSTYIRSIDANHMISVGDEGFFAYTYDQITAINAARTASGLFTITNDWPYAGSMGDWISTLQLPNISYGTIHNYATDNWGYTQTWGENWTKYHIEIANQYNKPCVMEEYDKGYSGTWTAAIDQQRAPVYSAYQTIIRDKGMAGDHSWMLVSRNYSDAVQSGYTLDNTAPVEQIWLYRVLWSDGHQYSRYDPYLGPLLRNHGQLMLAKNGTSSSNIAPIALAGEDQVVSDADNNGSQAVNLNGLSSIDPDGTISSYVWKENTTQLATVAQPTITLTAGTHTITLTVTDNNGASSTDNVIVLVLSGESIKFEAESASLTGSCTILTDATASNGQYVQMAATPATLAFTITNVPVTASYPVTIVTRSYAANSANGSKIQTVSSSAGGSIDYSFAASSTWRSDVLNLNLAAGTNTITITGNWGYIEVDYISIQGLSGGTSNNLTVTPATISLTSAAGSSPITVTSNVSWTASDDQTWLTLSPTSGSNNGTVTVTVTANTGTASRTATVTITGGSITRTVSVTQAAPTTSTLTVSPTTISLTSAAGSSPITVTSNVSWTASSNQTWLTVSPTSGSNNGTVTATATANTGTASRTATVTITGGSITRTVSVTQAAPTTSTLTVSPTTISLTSAAGSSPITVTSNVSWTASSNQSWLTVSPASGSNNGTVTATATANTSTSSRTATVTIIGGSITQTVSVTQAGASGTTAIATESFASSATSGGTGWAGNWTLGSNTTITTSGAAATYNLRMLNKGTGTRSVNLANYTGITLSFSYKGYSFDSSTEYAVAEFYNGSAWSEVFRLADGQEDNAWHTTTVNLPSGTSSSQIRFRIVASATNDYFYIDNIVINGTAGTSNSLTVSPATLSFTSAAGSSAITVTSNVSWTASSNQSWLTVSPVSGSNNGTVTVTATANTSTSSRTAAVTITGGSITRTISVTQAGITASSLTVSPTTISFTSAAGSSAIAVTSNVSWTASSNQSWLTVSPASGSNNGTVTATVTANTSTSSRTATVTITGGSITQTVSVTQSAPVVSNGEAENGVLTGTTIATSLTGYSGTGYVTSFDNTNDMVSIPVSVPTAGSYTITIRYASQYDNKNMHVSVNFVYVGSIMFPLTSVWTDLVLGTFTLNAGVNYVDIMKDWGYMDVDYVSASTLKSTEIGSGVSNASISDISVYPNPTTDLVMIKGADPTMKYTVVNLTGVQVLKGTGNEIEVSALKPGIYIIKTEFNKSLRFIKR